ncbi:prephenate dehydratase [Candidatus Sumerlaeota bacterium]|nr:prephenate dehydratase [Candidatus Sumerlaeota bacterium]
MEPLKKLRKEIDKIDRELVKLLDRRAQLAREIGKQKAEKNIAVFDPSRQKNIMDKVLQLSDGSFPIEGLKTVYTEIISTCLNLEKRLTIGYLGPEATFTHLAAISEFGSSCEFIPYDTIYDIFVAVDSDDVHFGVVPIENSTGGIVHHTLDRFLEFDVNITSEVIVYIKHTLLSNYPLKQIKKVYSNPQALMQCSVWLRKNLPKAELKEVSTTAKGVLMAKRTRYAGSIGSELAAKIYNIKIAARGIEDSKDNFTRFLVLGKFTPPPSGNDKTSIMFSTKDKPGALHSALLPFAKSGINLSKIESRPTRRRAWEYVFFVDLEGHIEDVKVKKAVKEVETYSTFLKVLGSYPCARVYKKHSPV